MSSSSVEVRGLSFRYPDGTQALYDVSLCVEPGEAVALVGANGAGKSTLLLHLNGYHLPPPDAIRIGELPLTRETAPAVRRAVGMVFQDPDDQLFMPTVEEDVAFGPLNLGLPGTEVAQRVTDALAQVGLSHRRERPPYRLSAGEKRSAAIATVLAMNPDILVMDEPSSHLDPRGRRRLIELLRTFHHTRIIATHDLEMVVEVCPRVVVMDGGRVVADGPARDVLNDVALMEAHGLERPHSLSHHHPH